MAQQLQIAQRCVAPPAVMCGYMRQMQIALSDMLYCSLIL